ncbi:hypothetical protein ESCO47_00092 [Escherichia phage vB_EcoM_ESCO47]|nr:hypothetical protein ESCO47_00092 [Escherichia phage vB_EcoM_ESCO47]
MSLNETLINDLRLAGYEVNTNNIGLIQIEGPGFILEHEFNQWWLYESYDDSLHFEYVDQFDRLDDALEAAKSMSL